MLFFKLHLWLWGGGGGLRKFTKDLESGPSGNIQNINLVAFLCLNQYVIEFSPHILQTQFYLALGISRSSLMLTVKRLYKCPLE